MEHPNDLAAVVIHGDVHATLEGGELIRESQLNERKTSDSHRPSSPPPPPPPGAPPPLEDQDNNSEFGNGNEDEDQLIDNDIRNQPEQHQDAQKVVDRLAHKVARQAQEIITLQDEIETHEQYVAQLEKVVAGVDPQHSILHNNNNNTNNSSSITPPSSISSRFTGHKNEYTRHIVAELERRCSQSESNADRLRKQVRDLKFTLAARDRAKHAAEKKTAALQQENTRLKAEITVPSRLLHHQNNNEFNNNYKSRQSVEGIGGASSGKMNQLESEVLQLNNRVQEESKASEKQRAYIKVLEAAVKTRANELGLDQIDRNAFGIGQDGHDKSDDDSNMIANYNDPEHKRSDPKATARSALTRGSEMLIRLHSLQAELDNALTRAQSATKEKEIATHSLKNESNRAKGLELELQVRTTDAETLAVKLEKYQGSGDQLVRNITALSHERDELVAYTETLQEKLAQLESDLSSFKSNLDDMRASEAMLVTQLKESRTGTEEQHRLVNEKNLELGNMRSLADEREAQVTKLQVQVDSSEYQVRNKEEIIGEMTNIQHELLATARDKNVKLEHATKLAEELQEQLMLAKSAHADTQHELTRTAEQVLQLQTNIANLETQIKTLNNEANVNADTEASLHERVMGLESSVNQLTEELEESQTRVSGLEEDKRAVALSVNNMATNLRNVHAQRDAILSVEAVAKTTCELLSKTSASDKEQIRDTSGDMIAGVSENDPRMSRRAVLEHQKCEAQLSNAMSVLARGLSDAGARECAALVILVDHEYTSLSERTQAMHVQLATKTQEWTAERQAIKGDQSISTSRVELLEQDLEHFRSMCERLNQDAVVARSTTETAQSEWQSAQIDLQEMKKVNEQRDAAFMRMNDRAERAEEANMELRQEIKSIKARASEELRSQKGDMRSKGGVAAVGSESKQVSKLSTAVASNELGQAEQQALMHNLMTQRQLLQQRQQRQRGLSDVSSVGGGPGGGGVRVNAPYTNSYGHEHMVVINDTNDNAAGGLQNRPPHNHECHVEHKSSVGGSGEGIANQNNAYVNANTNANTSSNPNGSYIGVGVNEESQLLQEVHQPRGVWKEEEEDGLMRARVRGENEARKAQHDHTRRNMETVERERDDAIRVALEYKTMLRKQAQAQAEHDTQNQMLLHENASGYEEVGLSPPHYRREQGWKYRNANEQQQKQTVNQELYFSSDEGYDSEEDEEEEEGSSSDSNLEELGGRQQRRSRAGSLGSTVVLRQLRFSQPSQRSRSRPRNNTHTRVPRAQQHGHSLTHSRGQDTYESYNTQRDSRIAVVGQRPQSRRHRRTNSSGRLCTIETAPKSPARIRVGRDGRVDITTNSAAHADDVRGSRHVGQYRGAAVRSNGSIAGEMARSSSTHIRGGGGIKSRMSSSSVATPEYMERLDRIRKSNLSSTDDPASRRFLKAHGAPASPGAMRLQRRLDNVRDKFSSLGGVGR